MKNLCFICLFQFLIFGQQPLPLMNGILEFTNNGNFNSWTHQSNHNGEAIFSVETLDVVSGSTKALKTTVNSLGSFQYSVQSSSTHLFPTQNQNQITIAFFAKASSNNQNPNLKVCLSDSSIGTSVFKGQTVTLSNQWKRYTQTFQITQNVNAYKLSFRYLTSNTTYLIDEVSVVVGSNILVDLSQTYQTVDGFGGGIKRRTEFLEDLPINVRNDVEHYAFKELHLNMIRFFIYHTIEISNDNDDPFDYNLNSFAWNYYSSNFSNSKDVAQVLTNAIEKSEVGFDHIIANSNTAPGWMKKNNSHKRLNDSENVLLNTLKDGMVDEFNEYIIAFVDGMKTLFNINVTAVSITNEPDFLNTYESMNLTPEELKVILPALRNRLDQHSFSTVQLLSPECALVSPSTTSSLLTEINSTATFIENMFSNAPAVVQAVDIIGTHTYFDSSHSADWASLSEVTQSKPVWVTESANLRSLDLGMDDASHYAKWITSGFNEGSMTAYMSHLLMEEHLYATPTVGDKEGSSALVLWDSNGVLLPKRYFVLKHFANLSGAGYKRISHQATDSNLYVTTFISPSQEEMVVHFYNDSEDSSLTSLDIPPSVTSMTQYVTDNTKEFESNNINVSPDIRYIEIEIPAKSMNSMVYTFSNTLNQKNDIRHHLSNYKVYPNPIHDQIHIYGLSKGLHQITLFNLLGQPLYNTQTHRTTKHRIDVDYLKSGVYLLQVQDLHNNSLITIKILKK